MSTRAMWNTYRGYVSPGEIPVSYAVTVKDDMCYALDGDTGNVVKYSSNAAEVIQYAIDRVKADTEWKKICLQGLFGIGTQVDINGACRLIVEGGYLKRNSDASIDHVLGVSDAHAEVSSDIILKDLTVDGNNAISGNNIVIGNLKGGSIVNVSSINAYRAALTLLRTDSGLSNVQYLPENIQVIGGKYTRGNFGTGALVLLGGRNNSIRDVFIDGNHKGQSAFIVYDNTFNRSYNLEARHCYVTGSVYNGIHVSVDYARIIDCYVTDSDSTALHVSPNGEQIVYAGSMQPITGVELVRCIVKENNAVGVVIEDVQHCQIVGGLIEKNASHGLQLLSSALHSMSPTYDTIVRASGLTVKNNNQVLGSIGVLIQNNQVGTDLYAYLDDLVSIDDQGVATQLSAVRLEGSEDVFLTWRGGRAEGDTYNFSNVSTGVNTEALIRLVRGWVTENNVLSSAFAIDGVTMITVTIAHGLAVAPSIENCYLTVVEDTNVDDWGYDLLKVESVDATNVVAKINVSNASATGGATSKLALQVSV